MSKKKLETAVRHETIENSSRRLLKIVKKQGLESKQSVKICYIRPRGVYRSKERYRENKNKKTVSIFDRNGPLTQVFAGSMNSYIDEDNYTLIDAKNNWLLRRRLLFVIYWRTTIRRRDVSECVSSAKSLSTHSGSSRKRSCTKRRKKELVNEEKLVTTVYIYTYLYLFSTPVLPSPRQQETLVFVERRRFKELLVNPLDYLTSEKKKRKLTW